MQAISHIDPFSARSFWQSSLLVAVLGVLVGVNNMFIGYKIAGISYDRLLEILLFLVLTGPFFRALKTSAPFRMMVLVLIIFGILRQLADISIWAQGASLTLDDFLRTFVKSFTYLIFFFLAYEGLRRNPQLFIKVFLLIAFLAGLLAFFQSPITPFTSEAWSLKINWFGKNLQNEYFENVQASNIEYDDQLLGLRVAGPYQYSIVYTYVLFAPLALSAYMYLARKKVLYMALFIFFVLIATMTLTRSLFLAAAILVFSLIGRLRLRYYILGISGAIFFIFYFELWSALEVLINSRLSNLTSDEGAHRNLLALCGLVTVLRNPIGVTGESYRSIRMEFYEKYGETAVRDLPTHNGFINLGFHFTILGYLVFMFWLAWSVRFYRRIRKPVRRFFLFAFLAYMAHSSFHNSFVFIGDYNALVILALFTIEAQWGILAKKQAKKETEPPV